MTKIKLRFTCDAEGGTRPRAALMPPPAAGMQLADTPRISAATLQRYCLNNLPTPLPTLSTHKPLRLKLRRPSACFMNPSVFV